MRMALILACCLALSFDYARGTPTGSRGVQSPDAAQERAHITRIEFRPATVEEGGGILISLVGKGNCTYTIDFGDGQSERRTAHLPDSLRHQYPPDRAYDVVATPEPPCEGVARARIDVRGIERGIWGVRVELASATAPEVVVLLDGKGTCSVVVDFGDGESEKRDVELPAKVNHKYLKGGSYEIHARALEPCRGEGRVRIEIKTGEEAAAGRDSSPATPSGAALAVEHLGGELRFLSEVHEVLGRG